MTDTPKLIADELAKLVSLKEAGHLSETEFAAAKSRLLGESAPIQTADKDGVRSSERPAPSRQTVSSAPPPGRQLDRKGVVIAAVIGVIVVGLIGYNLGKPASEPAATATASPPSSTSVEAAAIDTTPLPGLQWTYSHPSDDMTSKEIDQATVTSGNTLHLDSPYDGAQNGRLSLRNHPRFGTDIIVSIEQGQILCPSYEDCTLLVRFDEGEPTAFSAIGASDGSSETLFIRNYARFVAAMKSAKTVRVSLPIYQNGNQTLEFDVSGFDGKQYAGS